MIFSGGFVRALAERVLERAHAVRRSLNKSRLSAKAVLEGNQDSLQTPSARRRVSKASKPNPKKTKASRPTAAKKKSKRKARG
jgi:hypothetical protein